MDDNQLISKLTSTIVKIIEDPSKMKIRMTGSIIVLLVTLILYYLLKKWSYKQTDEIQKNHVLFLIGKYLLIFFLVLSLFIIWLKIHGALMIILIVGVAGFFLFIKGGVSNIVGGIIILNKRYFKIYDHIEIDGVKGTVLSVHLFYFTVMELGNWYEEAAPTGRTIKIPNQTILTNNVTNFNGINLYIWKEVKFPLTFESNWEKAEQIVKKIVDDYLVTFHHKYLSDARIKEKTLKQLEIYEGSLDAKKVVNIKQDDIELKFRFIVCFKEGSAVTTMINEKVLRAFSKEKDIELSGRRIYVTYEDKK